MQVQNLQKGMVAIMKKAIIGLLCLVVVIGGVFVYVNSTQSELEINIGAPVDRDTDRYSESIVIAHGTKEYSDEVYAQTSEILETFNENRAKTLPTLGVPYHLEVEVRFEDGKTIISNFGTYTDANGVKQDYYDEMVFDFIVTEVVTYPE